jgi:hypothetical protein
MINLIRCLAGAAFAAALLTTAAAADEPAAKPATKPAAAAPAKCVTQKDGYTHRGKRVAYAIRLTNTCERRMKCRVYAYVISAKGASRGQTTLILAPKSRGAAATKVYEMRVKMASGIAQVARECRAY